MIPKDFIRLSMILLIMLGGVFASCSYEPVAEGPLPENRDDATVTFALNVPGNSVPGTRGLSEQDETNVETINVLLFNKNTSGERIFYRMVPGVSIVNTPGNMKSFKAAIPIKDYDNYDITIIANGRKEVIDADLVKGESKSNALNKLVKTIPTGEKWNNNRIPMWGEALNVVVNANTNISGENAVKMTRMISRIDVKLSKKAATGSDDEEATGNDNFELVSVRLYNYSTKGTLVPDLENGWEINSVSNLPEATVPNQPTGGYGTALYDGTDVNEPLLYKAVDQHATAPNLPDSLIRAIYTLESPAGSAEALATNTCLVIGGKYQNGKETFYRIDFVTKNQESQLFEYLNLLRNFRYVVNITKISGEGFSTPEEAFYSRPVNIEVEILEWNEAYLTDVVFDGQNYLSVTPGLFEFYRDAREAGKNYEDNILYVKTDYTTEDVNARSGWYVEKIVDADNRDITADWLTLSPQSGFPKQQNEPVDEVKLVFGENKGAEMRSAIVIIAAGRLRYEVEVNQSTVPDIMLNIVDPETNLSVDELIFSSLVGEDPESQEFRVNWRPENADLRITNEPVIANPFPTGVGAPESGTLPGGNDGTGTIVYTIQPVGFSEADVTKDPFFEKSSKVDFIVTNGASYESKNIFLRQVHYNLLVDQNRFYMVDGSTYTLNVKSNAAWRIKEITQESNTGASLLNLKLSDNLKVGTLGGYNVSGEPVTFTMANNLKLGGHITVTFESTDPTKKFEDKTIELLCALPKVKIMGLANYTHWGYNVAILAQGGKNTNDAYTLLSSPVNFGLAPTSTVPSLGFEFLPHDASGTVGDATLKGYFDEEPDIIVLGQDLYIPERQTQLYVNFLKKGGVLIAYNEGNGGGIGNLMRAVFEDNSITDKTINAAGAVYALRDIDDLILNGPFGDLRNLKWGEDASSTRCVSGVPLDKIIVYTNGDDVARETSNPELTAFRHKEYNFVWFGDGGFVSSDDPTDNTKCPFMLDDEKRPVHKSKYGRSSAAHEVQNSRLFANTIYWGILQALKKE